ncbi:hypothetical protein SUGI_1151290 [Cryptomeria japonica]|uniref:uncharacterized protein LOC131072364 n=1 Tax=Cryptomeria japonica TaxID=3369 RepID=UPI00241480D5|nr:uncharacterized protein LOC131072364 [Cryptomeria japonica]GLJ53896.1 hypothetical protein SUGI_1151290 [Cryptomeria japonica]
MVLSKPYVLRMFISQRYITANVVDRNRGHIVVTASSIEKELKKHFECERTSNAKAAAIVGDVLAMRIKVESIPEIYSNIQKELDKGFGNRNKVWALINSLRARGVKIIDDAGL